MIKTNNEDKTIDILGALENSNDKLEESIQQSINNKENNNNTIYENVIFNEVLEIEKSIQAEEINQNTKKNIIKKSKKMNSFISAGIFWLKYMVTSTLIFSVLLLTTNYSAYFNIIESYIYQDKIKIESASLLNWAEASQIEEINKKEVKEIKSKKDKINELAEKEASISKEWKKFSITKLVSWLKDEEINLWINIIPYENRIVIPKIGKNIPLVDIKEEKVKWKSHLDNIFMKELEYWIVRYPGSAKPWRVWNSFIFGHSSNFPWIAWDYNDVFSRLWQLEEWDIVFSYYDQKKYKYKISTKKVIKPDDVSILKRDKNKKELTLMTCWPIGTTLNRLILIWELIEE